MKRRKAPNLLFGLCVHAPIHTNVHACTLKTEGEREREGGKERGGGGREKDWEGGHFLKGKQRREGVVCHH